MSLKTTLSLSLIATVQQQNDTGPARATHASNLPLIEWLTGIGYNQADLAFSDMRELAASTAENLNLYNGFTDGLGNTVTMLKAKVVLILNYSTTQILQVEPGSADPWLGMVSGTTNHLFVPAGVTDMPGVLVWVDPRGSALTSGAGKLAVTNPSGAAATYKIIVIGTSS